jgi:hypothetical protein
VRGFVTRKLSKFIMNSSSEFIFMLACLN